MIKVRAGQVWEFESGASNYLKGDRLRVMNLDRAGTFHDAIPINIERPYSIYSVSSKFLNECFVFIPQSDLEWLAVNVSKWNENHKAIHIVAHKSVFGCPPHFRDAYTKQQWQSMRYYLGLDKKPHCEFINGQWSETK